MTRRTLQPWPWILGCCLALAGCPEPDDDDTADDDTADDDDDAAEEPITDLGWRLHEEIESLVYATWTQHLEASGHVEYQVDPGQWRQSPTRTFGVGEQEQLLLGIPYAHEIQFRVVLDVDGEPWTTEDLSATTGPVPEGYVMPTLRAHEPALVEPTGPYLLGSINVDGGWMAGDFWKFIHDREGRLVWALLTPGEKWTLWSSVSRDGQDLLLDELWMWPQENSDSVVHRIKIDGTEIEEIPIPGAHHAFAETGDGSIAWAGYGTGEHKGNEVITVRAPNGDTEVVFDCDQYMMEIGDNSWCAHNALFWNESSNTFLYSLYSHSAILEIDPVAGDVVRSFGQVIGAYGFDPADAAFEWQHGVTYTDSGTLLVSTHTNPHVLETIVREYTVNDGASMLEQVWSHGEGDQLDSATNGDAVRLPGGNTLHSVGDGGRVREITPAGEVAWDLDWDGYYLVGRTRLLGDLYDLAP